MARASREPVTLVSPTTSRHHGFECIASCFPVGAWAITVCLVGITITVAKTRRSLQQLVPPTTFGAGNLCAQLACKSRETRAETSVLLQIDGDS